MLDECRSWAADIRAVASLLALGACLAVTAEAASPMAAPGPDVLSEARAIVKGMVAAERGPYERLHWYCADGTVHPPKPYPCKERGGGHQHAKYSAARDRLASLGWSVGTVYVATPFEELWDEKRRHSRLRELALERYLIDVDDGWVMRRARDYRGHVQSEDEEIAGRALLLRLFERPHFAKDELFLVREMVRTIPHPGLGEDLGREARRLSKELAELAPGFERIRVRIHTNPRPGDLDLTRAWLESARAMDPSSTVLDLGGRLAGVLEALHGEGARLDTVRAARRSFQAKPYGAALFDALEPVGRSTTPLERVEGLARALLLIREQVVSGIKPSEALGLLDLTVPLEVEFQFAVRDALQVGTWTRRDLMQLAGRLCDAGHALGLLSVGEHADIQSRIRLALGQGALALDDYVELTRQLERAGGWALGTVRQAFAEPLLKYSALEPKAVQFPDDLLRGSPMLPLARVSRILAADARELTGVRTSVFGNTGSGAAGLNPGLAQGPLRVMTETDLNEGRSPEKTDIVVLPRTVSELTPVAGILTVDEGNVLSHVQLLARNLGIPNVVVPPDALPALVEADGETVVLAVAPDGSVALERLASLSVSMATLLDERESLEDSMPAKREAPKPDLSQRAPLPLAELHAGLSGRVVGPKAANLGQLARLFPGRVAPAIGLPFGLFHQHASAGPESPKKSLDEAFAIHRAGLMHDEALAAEVALVRERVAALRLDTETRSGLLLLMNQHFGADGSYGVFVRSDTNVEDLPNFTGAGLNLTLPHVVGTEAILAAIPRVWASPYAPRAMAWRERGLSRPEEVYPSVLLMRSVPAEKSGVLVTADLINRREGLTVVTAWGVGGAVDGDSGETLVLRPDGTTDLMGEAKAPYKRRLAVRGGVEWVPATAGPVLTQDEQSQLRQLAREVSARLTAEKGLRGTDLPWDVEFGFEDGELRLFQVRPFIEHGAAKAARVTARLLGAPARRDGLAALDVPPVSTGPSPTKESP